MAEFVISGRLEAEADQFVSEVRQADGAVDQLSGSLQQSAGATRPATQATDAYARSVVRAGQSAREFARGATAAGRATRSSAPHYLNAGFVAQQAGLQFGDFAVQVGSGTSMLRAFIQQGPQFISMFGPFGAVVGAGVAVLGGLAAYLFESGEEAENAEPQIRSYSEAIDDLTKRIERAQAVGLSFIGQLNLVGAADLDALDDQMDDLLARRDAAIARLNDERVDANIFIVGPDAANDIAEAQSRVSENDEIRELDQDIAALQERIDEFRATSLENEFRNITDRLEPATEALRRYNEEVETIRAAAAEGVEGAVENEARLIELAAQRYQDALDRIARDNRERPERDDPFERQVLSLNRQIALLEQQAAAFGQGEQALERFAVEQRLLNAAQEAGVAIDQEVRAEISLLAGSYTQAAAALQELKAQEALAERERIQAQRAHETAIASIQQAQLATLPTYQRMVEEANRWRDEALAGLDAQKEGYEEFATLVEDIYQDRLAQAREDDLQNSRDWEAGVIRGFRTYADEATNAAAAAERSITGGLQTMEDAMVGYVTGSQVSFSNLIDSMIADMARLAIQQNITGPLAQAASSFLPSLFGGGGGFFGLFHGGGISGAGSMTRRDDPALYADAPRYHGGGMSGSYRLGHDEERAVLKHGEGVFTPMQMQNADRIFDLLYRMAADRSGQGRIQINIHNNSGQADARAETSEGPFGELNIDIFVEEIDASMAELVSRGTSRTDHAMADKYNFSRTGAALNR